MMKPVWNVCQVAIKNANQKVLLRPAAQAALPPQQVAPPPQKAVEPQLQSQVTFSFLRISLRITTRFFDYLIVVVPVGSEDK